MIRSAGINKPSDGSPALPHPRPGKKRGVDHTEADKTGHCTDVFQAKFANTYWHVQIILFYYHNLFYVSGLFWFKLFKNKAELFEL